MTTEAVGGERVGARTPFLVGVALLLVVAAVLPWADRHVVTLPGLVPAWLAGLFGCHLLTVALLVARARGGDNPRVVVLAAGSVWSVVAIVGIAVVTRGLQQLDPAVPDPDALGWIWLSAHVVPPLVVAVALTSRPSTWRRPWARGTAAAPADPRAASSAPTSTDDPTDDLTDAPTGNPTAYLTVDPTAEPLGAPRGASALASALGPILTADGAAAWGTTPGERLAKRLLVPVLLTAVTLVVVAPAAPGSLPDLNHPVPGGPAFAPSTSVFAALVGLDILCVLVALAGMRARGSRSRLEAWAVVVVVAQLVDVLLTAMIHAPYDLAFMAARSVGLVAALLLPVAMLHDIVTLHRRTARDAMRLEQQNRELLDATRLRDHLVAVVSHEMRTPLAGLQGYLEVLASDRDGLDEAAETRMLERSWMLTRRLTLLAEDLLAVAAVENGSFVIVPETVNLAHQLDECVACFPGVDLRVECPSDLLVHADTLRLQQVLANLVRNAHRHGAEPITLSASGTSSQVVIRVADSGPGVPRDFVHRLFDRYAQGTTSPGGSGLGLAVVRDLVRAHDGTVRYDLTDPAFVITLPQRDRAGRTPTVTTTTAPSVGPSAGTGPAQEPGQEPAPTSALAALALVRSSDGDQPIDQPIDHPIDQPIEKARVLTAKK